MAEPSRSSNYIKYPVSNVLPSGRAIFCSYVSTARKACPNKKNIHLKWLMPPLLGSYHAIDPVTQGTARVRIARGAVATLTQQGVSFG